MKRIALFFLVSLIIIVFIAGCNDNYQQQEVPTSQKTEIVSDAPDEIIVNTVEPGEELADDLENNEPYYRDYIPDCIEDVYYAYMQISVDYGLEYYVKDSTIQELGDTYEFKVGGITDEFTKISFDPNSEYTYSMAFTNNDNVQAAKDFITATIMITSKIDFESAEEQMQNIINSYYGDTYSSYIISDDYVVFLIPNALANSIITLRVDYKDEIFSEINTDEYSHVDYETALAPLNAFKKIILEAEVIETTREPFSGFDFNCVRLKDKDGNEYFLIYLFEYFPIELGNGATYTFYGYLTKSEREVPVIKLEYLEPQNTLFEAQN